MTSMAILWELREVLSLSSTSWSLGRDKNVHTGLSIEEEIKLIIQMMHMAVFKDDGEKSFIVQELNAERDAWKKKFVA